MLGKKKSDSENIEKKRSNQTDEKSVNKIEMQSAQDKISTQALKQMLSDSQDIIFSNVSINSHKRFDLTIVMVEGLVNSKMVDDDILKPLIQEEILGKTANERELVDYIMSGSVYHSQRVLRDKLCDCVSDLLEGSVILVFDELNKAISFEIKGFEKRGITEPSNENVIKGSKESFIEVLRINTSLIRRRLRTTALKIQEQKIGKRSSTTVSVIYISDIANQKVVEQVKQRLNSVVFDGIVSAGQLEGLLVDNHYTFIPQAIYTERVDKFCANILEGRVGILADGLPTAFIVPVDINAFLQAPEDYALNFNVSSLFRLLRHICAFVALILPAFYVSVTTFHQEMIPTKLAISIIRSKQGVPLPTYLEVLLMLIAFEVLLEAGLRLPKAVGQAVSIVGALVIGEAAITANILSPGVVIIISAAGITGFVIPSQDLSNAIRLFRLILVLFSITSGLFGVTIGLIILLYHLCSLEVYGVPYMSPFVANEGKGMLYDSILRISWFKMKKRPSNIGPKDILRQSSNNDGHTEENTQSDDEKNGSAVKRE